MTWLQTIAAILAVALGAFCSIVSCLFFRDASLFAAPFAFFSGCFFYLAGRLSR